MKPENLYPKYIKGIWFPAYKLLWCANTLDFVGIKLQFTNLQFHCVKSVQIRSFFWSAFFHTQTEYGEIRSICPYLVRKWENTKYPSAFSPNAGKYKVSLRFQSESGKIWSIFLYSVRMPENTKYLSVFRPNGGKYGTEKTSLDTLDTFHEVFCRYGTLQAENKKHFNYMKTIMFCN